MLDLFVLRKEVLALAVGEKDQYGNYSRPRQYKLRSRAAQIIADCST